MSVVVVHRGARDSYQVASAMWERKELEALVTDLYWSDASGRSALARLLPGTVQQLLSQRSQAVLEGAPVRLCWMSGLFSLALEKLPRLPFAWRRRAMRWNDDRLGQTAGLLATARGAALLSYSYYGHAAFSTYRGTAPRILFQAHPHPASMRRILHQEKLDHPDCAASLDKEWELSLPEEDYLRLVRETEMADYWLAASSFTAQTLVENGAAPERIHVVPYGVDLQRFQPGEPPVLSRPLRLLFVGTINQRKGIKYLLEALRLVGPAPVEVTVCGRVVDDLQLFRDCGSQVQVRPSVSATELVAAYQQADLFVFPSIAEGFGQVLLEALACGLPVLSTTRTAAADLVTTGEDGFVVAPRRPELLAERIVWALGHRAELAAMKRAARNTAERFTWRRFRTGVADATEQILQGRAASVRKPVLAEVTPHV